ncbi:MAG: elongation factor P [Dehalococcoidia bacterium]|nr:Elongation factor P [Chloroflexota bacterium]MBT9158905.1 Elongation factor P [Chloroflexota bacterium]
MIDVTEARKGVTIELDGRLYTVIEYQHIKVGRGSAQVRLKLKDIRADHTIERTFQSGERLNRVEITERPAQYLYQDGDFYYFMDQATFDQIPLSNKMVGDALGYLKEGMIVQLSRYEGETIGIGLPITVELEISDTGPAFKGDTATSGTKPATLETGIMVQVPMFLKTGDVVRVDTRKGTYVERA